MLKEEELELLYRHLNSCDETLEKASQPFLTVEPSPSEPIFRWQCCLLNYLLLNVLSRMQRLVAIFVLLECVLREGVKTCPFAMALFWLYDNNRQPFERMMIQEVLAGGRRDKYAKMKMAVLSEEYQLCMQEKGPPPAQFELLRREALEALPKIPASKMTQIRAILPDFPPNSPPDQPLRLEKLTVKDHKWQGRGCSLQRPLPSFLPIDDSEFQWVGPGLITDPVWDCSQLIHQRIREAQEVTLSKNQATQLVSMLQRGPYVVGVNIKVSNFAALFTKNPQLALSLLNIAPEQTLVDFYDKLVHLELTVQNLENIKKLITETNMPNRSINDLVIKILEKCEMITNEQQRDKFARLVIKVIKELIRSRKLDPHEINAEIRRFSIELCQVEEVAKLYRLFAQK